MGGGSGHIAVGLATVRQSFHLFSATNAIQKFPKLNCIVQDISSDMLAVGQKDLDDAVAKRITFMQHDFFAPQLVDASAYLLRQVVHNWNDDDCVRLFRALVPALERCRAGTPILINDIVLPALDEKTASEEYGLRQLDIAMWVVLGAKQRSEGDFAAILKRADSRFKVSVTATSSSGAEDDRLPKLTPRVRWVWWKCIWSGEGFDSENAKTCSTASILPDNGKV